jgi:hypothetical protein
VLTQVLTHPIDTMYTRSVIGGSHDQSFRSLFDGTALHLFSFASFGACSQVATGVLANVLSHEVYHAISSPLERLIEPVVIITVLHCVFRSSLMGCRFQIFGYQPTGFQILSVVALCSAIPMLISYDILPNTFCAPFANMFGLPTQLSLQDRQASHAGSPARGL